MIRKQKRKTVMGIVKYKDRKNTQSRKWDGCLAKFGREDLLPLWIADMDFETPECVKNSLKSYVDMGAFGYYDPPKEYFEAFIQWEEKRHGYKVETDWIRFAPGVVPAFNWIIHMLTDKNDSVIIMPPVYYPFREAVENNHRKLVVSPLIRTDDSYIMDYEGFEKEIIDNQVKLFIFCSPHNPAGRVWKKEEIQQVLDICKKHQVYVISDEIHQDLIMSGNKQIPSASVGDYDDMLITLTAATKTFNLASCQNSFVIIPDKKLREKYDTYLEELRIHGGNAFGYVAIRSAYEGGAEWLEEVLTIIESNYHLLKERLESELPKVWIPRLEGTYLMWIDLAAYVKPEQIEDVIGNQCGLAVDYGSWFGGKDNGSCIRINLATRQENIELAAKKIIDVLKDAERR